LASGRGITPIQPLTPPAAPVPSPPTSSTDPRWKDPIFRAIFNGERNINALLRIGRLAGGPNDKAIRTAVLEFLKVPFPQFAEAGPMPCEQHGPPRLDHPPDQVKPDLRQEGAHPDPIFTGRYGSSKADGRSRYFWAINQAGKAVIAIRTLRYFRKPYYDPETGQMRDVTREYRELRGDLQSDGTAVLFQANKPENFWGYLIRGPKVDSVSWKYGSYLGPDGKRVFVDATRDDDEELTLEIDRPTMMESLFKSDDKYLSVLLQQREWFPLTDEVIKFLEDGANSNWLKLLIEEDYFKKPASDKDRTYQENLDKNAAAGRIVNYLGYLLWDGDPATKPYPVSLTPELEQVCGQEVREFVKQSLKVIPQGHYNNLVLATFVAKVSLARQKVNRGGQLRSFLDELTTVANEQLAAGWPGAPPGGKMHAEKLSKLLDIPLDRAMGTYQYSLKFDATQAGPFVWGTLLVEKLTPDKWPLPLTCDVFAGSPDYRHLPAPDTVFDVTVETPQEWTPNDFEGTLLWMEVDVSAKGKGGKLGITWKGSFLRSHNGLLMSFDNAEASVGPSGGGGKPKIGKGWNAILGRVSLKTPNAIIDLSKPFPGSKSVVGNLDSAAHFCHDSALLTPAARQFLRFVCADRLAVLSSPEVKIMIIGHTDRTGTDAYNLDLSDKRAQNVKLALQDILYGVLQIPLKDIPAVGLGTAMAKITDLLKSHVNAANVRTPEYRRVDLLINFSLVASFHELLRSP
jgi:outer membrane protein OmpA-like peptidoglycan-associated protein